MNNDSGAIFYSIVRRISMCSYFLAEFPLPPNEGKNSRGGSEKKNFTKKKSPNTCRGGVTV